MNKTPRTDKYEQNWIESGNARKLIELTRQLETELVDMRESEQRFSKCFERIARAVGIKSPLVLMTMAESDEENYAEILARHIENREKAKESLGL